ncbi:SGNH/GDSL hydrolase family protein [Pseudobythopirellula maris]|uniref:SGNH/GDSL hydrolase family protein n=1 Tax=Pseudobythopirellula maris TaxID=2527991 RepID=UPI0011B430B5|nr:SGNH/GDSL hydrolase family protein [Pseudobythopirellula maris]
MPTIVTAARELAGGPIEMFMTAAHGRSYGLASNVMGRRIVSIRDCGLWNALDALAPASQTNALVTDVGNDLLYGVAPARVADWVAECVDRLVARGARVRVVGLPLHSIEGVGRRRFAFFQKIFFPFSRLRFDDARALSRELDERLQALCHERSLAFVAPPRAWYGWDPIHVRRARRAVAWNAILRASEVDEREIPREKTRLRAGERFALRRASHEERRVFGALKRAKQPCARLNDGSTLSLF